MLDTEMATMNRSGWPTSREMIHFCRPEGDAESDLDRKLLLSAETFDIPFEGQILQGYRWGEGKTVLLMHGWSSRASHLAFLARSLAKAGFEVVAFDGPAHGRSSYNNTIPRTNLPEFCRALYHVAGKLGPLYGLVGHSFGGAAASFTVAGQAQIAGYRVAVKKLVLISSPCGINGMIEHYCRSQGYREGGAEALVQLLENEYPLSVKEYEVSDALKRVDAEVLVVHGSDDLEVPWQTPWK
jgi:alpha-beta hydrolase superfamily lysophospholipase